MSNSRTRAIQIALIGITALCLVLIGILIIGVHSFEFRPARQIDIPPIPTGGWPAGGSLGWRAFTVFMQVLFIIAIVGVIYSLLFNRKFRIYYIVWILIFAAISFAVEFTGCDRRPPEDTASTAQQVTTEPIAPMEDQNDTDVEASGLQYVVVAVALSSAIVLAAIAFGLRWVRRRSQADRGSYDEVLESLSTAARRIRAGEDPYTVVLFCYQEMLRILTLAARIDATYLTAREFQGHLQRIGLSGESIANLTEMFEVVRYAGRVDSAFVERALACLDAIQEAHADDQP